MEVPEKKVRNSFHYYTVLSEKNGRGEEKRCEWKGKENMFNAAGEGF